VPAFEYRNNKYSIEEVSVRQIADTHDTPFYCYSKAAIEAAYRDYVDAFSGHDVQVCYALKANSNLSVVKLLADLGAGADVVSVGELKRALRAGIPASRIVYSGVAKTAADIEFALAKKIRQFNVESEPELATISDVATQLGTSAAIAFRINPDVDAKTHEKISTGKSENKFGIPWQAARAAYADAARLPGIQVCGIDMHIGSQIRTLEPYQHAFEKIAELTRSLRDDGHDISTIDLGGGLGVDYERASNPAPTPTEYARVAIDKLQDLDCRLIIEPGRSLVANAGVLVAQVIYVKQGSNRKFLIIDAAMNDFIRPSMYDAHHEIAPERNDGGHQEIYDVVGPVCETGDTFARDRELNALQAGDLVIIEGAGAYGAVMSSSYNTRPLIAEILVDGQQFAVVRQRLDDDSIIALDEIWP
jgi:diaminopimelate decarboxylase